MKNISLDGLYAGGARLVDGCFLDMAMPGITLLGGESGCGKSSLIHAVHRRLLEDGLSSVLVRQGSEYLVDDWTVAENVLGESGVDSEREDVLGFLQMWGLGELAARKVSCLSGGERRLTALARGARFAVPGGFLLIDEPTNDLDADVVQLVRQRLLDLSGSVALLVVSHDDRILSLPGSVYCIADGRLLLERSHDDLLGEAADGGSPATSSAALPNGVGVTSVGTSPRLAALGRKLPKEASSVLLYAATAMLFLLICSGYFQAAESKVPSFAPAEVDLFLPVSMLGAEMSQQGGAVELGALDALGKPVGSAEMEDSIRQAQLYAQSDDFDYCLDGVDWKGLEVIPLEYRDDDRTFFQVMSYYKQANGLDEDALVDASGWFSMPGVLGVSDDDFDARAVAVTREGLEKARDLLLQEQVTGDLHCTYAVLRPGAGESEESVLRNPAVKELAEHNVYVRSESVAQGVVAMEAAKERSDALEQYGLLFAASLALAVCLMGLYVFMARRMLLLIHASGADDKQVEKLAWRKTSHAGAAAAMALVGFAGTFCLGLGHGDDVGMLVFGALLIALPTQFALLHLIRKFACRCFVDRLLEKGV